jgi:hypothetical protein
MEVQHKMNKKLIGGLTVVALVAAVGVVFASAETNGTTSNSVFPMNFWQRQSTSEPPKHNATTRNFCGRQPMPGYGPFYANLTEAQQAELKALMETLRSQNATPQEIRAAVQQKLDEYGVFDRQLNNAINQTEQRLQILNREKELRSQGYSWENITSIIQQEYNVTINGCNGYNMGPFSDHGRGPPRGMPGPKTRKDSGD